MTRSLVAAGSPTSKGDETDYQPGACNIGPAEIERRWRAGHLGVVLTLVTLAIAIAMDGSPLLRLIVAIPAAGTAVAYLEAALKFCVAFGSRGVFNFGQLGTLSTIADPRARNRDRVRALQITFAGLLIGLAIGAIAVALPIWRGHA
jgi:hypothetical protein